MQYQTNAARMSIEDQLRTATHLLSYRARYCIVAEIYGRLVIVRHEIWWWLLLVDSCCRGWLLLYDRVREKGKSGQIEITRGLAR